MGKVSVAEAGSLVATSSSNVERLARQPKAIAASAKAGRQRPRPLPVAANGGQWVLSWTWKDGRVRVTAEWTSRSGYRKVTGRGEDTDRSARWSGRPIG